MSDNITILVKLFETLKDSSDKNEETTQKLIVQQLELVSHIKHLPIEDLNQALKDHAKDSANDIDACAETVEITGKDLMTEIKKVASKVNKMILVVLVTFAILTGTYVFISNVADYSKKVEVQKKNTQKKQQNYKNMTDKITEEIRKEMKKYDCK